MAAANESQGLKIAVAAFVALTVILAVTSYLLYSNYSETAEKLTAANTKADEKDRLARKFQEAFNGLRDQAGFKAEDYDSVKDEIKKATEKHRNRISELSATVKKMIDEAKAEGKTHPDVEKFEQFVEKSSQDYLNEATKTLDGSIDRLVDLVDNETRLLAALSVDYQTLRKEIESANSVNTGLMNQESGERKKAQELQVTQQNEHEQRRQELLAKVDALQTALNNLQTEHANLKNQYRQFQDERAKERETLAAQIVGWRGRAEAKENVLDHPDGYVLFVDYSRGSGFLRTDLTRRKGARPQMVMSIFDRKAAGVPTERPKGTIELIDVNDQYSTARIISTADPLNPIRRGDIVYSPSWNANEPQRFALIGKLDIDRNGSDDRSDIKRVIENAGGIIVYDLPPPGAGREYGKMDASTAWYVIDNREPIIPKTFKGGQKEGEGVVNPEEKAFYKKKSDALTEARLLGIRPIELSRLMGYLGYQYNMAVHGQTESVNRRAIDALLHPEGMSAPVPGAGGSRPAAKGADEEEKAKGDEDMEKSDDADKAEKDADQGKDENEEEEPK